MWGSEKLSGWCWCGHPGRDISCVFHSFLEVWNTSFINSICKLQRQDWWNDYFMHCAEGLWHNPWIVLKAVEVQHFGFIHHCIIFVCFSLGAILYNSSQFLKRHTLKLYSRLEIPQQRNWCNYHIKFKMDAWIDIWRDNWVDGWMDDTLTIKF